METTMGTIEVCHISKSFRETEVLKDITLHCTPGRIYGFVGHNGSGKTVLFKCICGFLSCDSGQIKIDGKVMGKEIDMLTDAGIIIEENSTPYATNRISSISMPCWNRLA